MQKITLLLAALALGLCLTASAAVHEFPRFSVNVPDGWTQTVHGDLGLEMVAPDGSAKFSIGIMPLGGRTLEELARSAASALNGSLGKDDDGDFTITYTEDGKSARALMHVEEDFVLGMALVGEHPQVEEIMESIREK